MARSNVENEIEELLVRAEELEVFPAAALRIRQVADSPHSSLLDLEEAVSSDPTLSAQILKVANSPFFGLRREVSTVQRALFVLGFRATRDMALTLAMLSLGRKEDAVKGEVSRHCQRVGVAAQCIASTADDLDARELFLTGMLHDLGKLILLAVDADRARDLYGPEGGVGDDLVTSEREIFGFDHAHLGAACLEQWNLPVSTFSAVRGHHSLEAIRAGEPLSASIIWLADAVDHGIARERQSSEVAETLCESEACRIAGFGGLVEERLVEVVDFVRESSDPLQIFS